MANFCRELITDRQVEAFVDSILCIHDNDDKRAAINRIANAERNMRDYYKYPTLTHSDYRDFQFKRDSDRVDLRERIVQELFENTRLMNDDDIVIGQGGAAPRTKVQYEGKVFYIIGPPAAAKSGIANTIADKFGCYILDSDYAKRKLPEYMNQIGGASLVHDESQELIFGTEGLFLRHCLKNKANLVIPKIGHNMHSVLSYCEALREKGYTKVYLVCVDLDRQKATQRAYQRFVETNRYVPLSLVFDNYGNQPALTYYKLKQIEHPAIDGYALISTDVPRGQPARLVDVKNMDFLKGLWR